MCRESAKRFKSFIRYKSVSEIQIIVMMVFFLIILIAPDKWGIHILFFHENICCVTHLEVSQ